MGSLRFDRGHTKAVLAMFLILLATASRSAIAEPSGRTHKELAIRYGLSISIDPQTERLTMIAPDGGEIIACPAVAQVLVNGKAHNLSARVYRKSGDFVFPEDVGEILAKAGFVPAGTTKRAGNSERPAVKKTEERDVYSAREVGTDYSRKAVFKLNTVMIDPGHGGRDPGAIGPGGLKEKDVNLAIALKIGARLKAKGIEVIYTRKNDVFVGLADRAGKANEAEADLFISIHANAAAASARGFEVFKQKGADDISAKASKSETGRAPTAKDIGADLPADAVARDIVCEMNAEENRKEATELGEMIIAALDDVLSVPNRGYKEKNLCVLRETLIPTMLVEVGFLSNPQSEKLLKTGKYRQKIADAIADAIIDYKKLYDSTGGFRENAK